MKRLVTLLIFCILVGGIVLLSQYKVSFSIESRRKLLESNSTLLVAQKIYVTDEDLVNDKIFSRVFREAKLRFGYSPQQLLLQKPFMVLERRHDSQFYDSGMLEILIIDPNSNSPTLPLIVGNLSEEFGGETEWPIPILSHPGMDWHKVHRIYFNGSVLRFFLRLVNNEYSLYPEFSDRKNGVFKKGHYTEDYCCLLNGQPTTWIRSVTYYEDPLFAPDAYRQEKIKENEKQARNVLEEIRKLASISAPTVSAFHGPIELITVPPRKDAEASVSLNPFTGHWEISYSEDDLAIASKLRLRAIIGHELGHIARSSGKPWDKLQKAEEDYWQNAADAFSLKLIGTSEYHDYLIFSDHLSEQEAEIRIVQLQLINKRFESE